MWLRDRHPVSKMRAMQQSGKDQLAREALPTVETIVVNLSRRFGNRVDRDELRSFAFTGLAEAINRYDPSMNASIGAFAAPRIRGAIYDGLCANTHLPRRLARQVAFFRRADDMMLYEAKRPRPGNRSESVHRLADRLKELADAYVTVAMTGDDLPDSQIEDTGERLQLERYKARLQQAMETLSETQKTVVHLFFHEDQNLSRIAESLGHTPSWTSRCLASALRKLRRSFQPSIR